MTRRRRSTNPAETSEMSYQRRLAFVERALLEKYGPEIRRRVSEFWGKFSCEELESIIAGKGNGYRKFFVLGGPEVMRLDELVSTAEERATIAQVMAELEQKRSLRSLAMSTRGGHADGFET